MSDAIVYYPLMADLTGKRCVVVGGGAVGWRRASSLLDCGADVTVIAPEGGPELREAAGAGRIAWIPRGFREGDLDGAALVFAAADDAAANELVRRESQRLGVWMNAAYEAGAGDFIVPSVVRRGRLVMSVTTGGASPALARRIADDWSEAYGAEYEAYMNVLWTLRQRVLASGADDARKRACLAEALRLDLSDRLRRGEPAEDVTDSAWALLQHQYSLDSQ